MSKKLQTPDQGHEEPEEKPKVKLPRGQPKKVKTPNKLWLLFVEYLEWNEENNYNRWMPSKFGPMAAPQERMISLDSFFGWVARYKNFNIRHYFYPPKGTNYDDYLEIVTRIKSITRGDMIAGAGSGVFNPLVVTRLAGLADKVQVTEVEEQPLFPEDEDDLEPLEEKTDEEE